MIKELETYKKLKKIENGRAFSSLEACLNGESTIVIDVEELGLHILK